jgi:adenylate cyclase
MERNETSDDEESFEFKSDATGRAFDALVGFFIEDYMVKKFVAEKSGWRTIAEIAHGAHLSPSALYGKHSTIGPVLDEPIKRGLVETRIFPGERGRGGEVMRLRIAYEKEPIKQLVNMRVRTKSGTVTRKQRMMSDLLITRKDTDQLSKEEMEERKLAAIMFTDIVGFTALAQADEPRSLQVLERHDRLLKPLFPKYRGRAVKSIGDSFLVEFESALDAVNCAIEIQKFLHDYNISSQEDWKIKLRIGIHLGDVVLKGGDIFGDAVNIASRIGPLAEPEGICLTQQVFDQVHNKIAYTMQSLRESELKNVKSIIKVYAVHLPWKRDNERYTLVGQRQGAFETGKFRIAVLPFANLSPDPNDDYFSDGITEELISTISKVSGLQVIARTSIMNYKGDRSKKIDEIAQELKVGTILEGSVRKADSKLRITVQLIDTRTSEHIWAESYNRELKDIFAVQSDIAETVANSLKVKLLSNERKSIEKQLTSSTEAYALCLKGIYHNINASTESDLRKSLRYFERAIELDPNFALAYSWLSDCYSTLVQAGYQAPRETIHKAEEAVRKALSIDPDLPDAHRVLGFLLTMIDRPNWVEAELETKRALDLNPSVEGGHESYAWILAYLGRLEEALSEAKRAQELDPLSPTTYRTMAQVLFYSRRYDEAIEELKKMHLLNCEDQGLVIGLAQCYMQLGQYEKASEEFTKTLDPSKGEADLALYYFALLHAKSGHYDQARKILKDFKRALRNQFIPAFAIAQIHAALDERDYALHVLEQAFDEGEIVSLLDLKVSPFWDNLRSDPRFVFLLKKMGLENKAEI